MLFMKWFVILFSATTSIWGVNLEEAPHSFVLETKQISIPEFPKAFNPSILRWEGKLLLSFRNIANPKDSYNSSEIGLIWLNDDFEPLEYHFKKRSEVFVPNTSEINNLPQFSYRCHILIESNPSPSPNFWISEFPRLTHVFERKIWGKWK